MKRPTNEEVIARAEKKFPPCKSYWERHHTRFTKIKRFTKCHGEYGQWDEATYRARANQNPPRLTLSENLLGPFVLQVANDLKQSDFGAMVKPKDGGADVKLAEVRQGLHRGIQQIGGFKRVLDQAIDDLVVGGLGAFRLSTKYADPMSFRKEIEYLELDPTRFFHGDGTNRKSDFSDVTDSFVYEPYGADRFKAEFDKDPEAFLGTGKCNAIWGSGLTPWVTEYFFVQEEPATLVMYQGKEYLSDEFEEMVKDQADEIGVKPKTLIDPDENGQPITRPTTERQIWWAKMAGMEVLKLEAWPGYCIPNFLATGRKVMIDGELSYYGLGEPAVDVQVAHNYSFSAMVERAGLAPKVRIFAASESIPAGQRPTWDNLNTTPNMVAYFNAYDEEGRTLPTPHQEPPIQSDPAFANLRAMTEQGIRNVLGMWETSLGAQSNERSGIAIQTRERQSDTGNYDWGANLAVAAEHCFQVTDELLNKVIDVPTQVRIVGEDDKEETIWAASLEEGAQDDRYFDLNRGKYDLFCKMMPGADTKRDEQSRGMEALFQGDPEMRAVLSPEYIAIQNWKGADKLSKVAASYRAMKFPGIETGEEDGEEKIPPKAQQQMQQMQAQMQQMTQQLQEAQKAMAEAERVKIENAAVKADKTNDTERVKIEWFKAKTDAEAKHTAAQLKGADTNLKADDQKHDQAVENARLVMDSHAAEHQRKQDAHQNAVGLDAHFHQQDQDHRSAEMAGEKMHLDHEAKVSAQAAKRTGASGESADTGRKTVTP